ncbi:MAG: hypothetical protein FWG23_03035 [Eggerthellaceae bacterium]|nr:hypothetical protein [Eggerthellaceae bacterium]
MAMVLTMPKVAPTKAQAAKLPMEPSSDTPRQAPASPAVPATPGPPRAVAPAAISIECIVVKADRIVCTLACNPRLSHTTPALAARLTAQFPDLPRHTCKSAEGTTFAAVMGHTSLPHLFEHLVIDLQVQAGSDEARTFIGTSEWIDAAIGKARVEVSFTDDLSALRAFRDATQILNDILL